MEFTAEQLIVLGMAAAAVGVVVSVIVQLVLYVAKKAGKPVDEVKSKQLVLFIVGFGVALVLAFTWGAPVMPALPVFAGDYAGFRIAGLQSGDYAGFLIAGLQWFAAVLAVALAVVSQAHLIYRAILEKVVYPKLPILRL